MPICWYFHFKHLCFVFHLRSFGQTWSLEQFLLLILAEFSSSYFIYTIYCSKLWWISLKDLDFIFRFTINSEVIFICHRGVNGSLLFHFSCILISSPAITLECSWVSLVFLLNSLVLFLYHHRIFLFLFLKFIFIF